MFFRKKDPYHIFRRNQGKSKYEQKTARRDFSRSHTHIPSSWDKQRRERERYVDQRLVVGMCPKCEARVKREYKKDLRNLGCGWTIYTCDKCGFIKSDWWDDEDDYI